PSALFAHCMSFAQTDKQPHLAPIRSSNFPLPLCLFVRSCLRYNLRSCMVHAKYPLPTLFAFRCPIIAENKNFLILLSTILLYRPSLHLSLTCSCIVFIFTTFQSNSFGHVPYHRICTGSRRLIAS